MDQWMSNLPGDLTLSDLTIPGSHDAGMYKNCDSDGSIRDSPVHMDVKSNMVLCQDKSILEQLRMGVRMFDIRVRPTNLHHLHTFHFTMDFGGFGASLVEVLMHLKRFLDTPRSSRETVILKLNHCAPSVTSEIITYVRDILGARLYYTTQTRRRYPTIGLIPLDDLRGKVIPIYGSEFVSEDENRRREARPDDYGHDIISFRNPKGDRAWSPLSARTRRDKLILRGFYSNRRRWDSILQIQRQNLRAWHNKPRTQQFTGELMQLYWTSTYNPNPKVSGLNVRPNIEANTAAIWRERPRQALVNLLTSYLPQLVHIDFVDLDKTNLIINKDLNAWTGRYARRDRRVLKGKPRKQ